MKLFLSIFILIIGANIQAQTSNNTPPAAFKIDKEKGVIEPYSTDEELPYYEVPYALNLFGNNKKVLKGGTPIYFKSAEIKDFEALNPGKYLRFLIYKDITIDGDVVIQANTMGLGKIVSKKAPTVTSPASLVIEIESIDAVDGQAILLTSSHQELTSLHPGRTFTATPNELFVAYVARNITIQIP